MQNVGAWRTLRVFNKISSHDAVSWNAILGRYAIHGPGMEALKHFEKMCEEGVQPNDITFVCLLLACSCANLVDEGLCYCVLMSTVYTISAIWNTTLAWLTFLVMLAIYRRQRI
jgi:pentatricopeptide repeat protein